jgi:hypothetical protein
VSSVSSAVTVYFGFIGLGLLILVQYLPAVPLVWYKGLTGMLIITQLVMASVFLWPVS